MIHDFPYTDLHELNLDWFLKQYKKLFKDIDELKTYIQSQQIDEGRELVKQLDAQQITGREGYYLNAMVYDPERNSYFVGIKPNTAAGETYNGEAMLAELDTDFNIINSRFDAGYGRINDIKVINGRLVIAPAYSSYMPEHFCAVIADRSTLQITSYPVILANASVVSVAHDPENHIVYMDLAPSGSLYHFLYAMNEDLTGATRIDNMYFIPREGLVLQGADFFNKKLIGLANSRNPIGKIYFKYNYKGLEWADMLPAYKINSSFEEPEAIYHKDLDLYMATIYKTRYINIYKIHPSFGAYQIPISTRENIPLINGMDLNNLIDPGMYSCHTTALAQQMTNCPVSEAFIIDVINTRGYDEGTSQYRLQVLRAIRTDLTYIRRITITDHVPVAGQWTSF